MQALPIITVGEVQLLMYATHMGEALTRTGTVVTIRVNSVTLSDTVA